MRGLSVPSYRSFLASLPRDQAMNLLVSHASKVRNIHIGLADAPEPDEDVPQELPESLLHTCPEDETRVDPKNPMVEDAVPLSVVPLAADDNVAPTAAK
ncbi:UNVERIFIED_CONTAM: hypothetical protein Slati_2717800 [Sesamum latifolium]|uniref:Uncharacterized protein n=1 Tax=Sesamum latifolium TaxID=2727402 RepID=A0AAW2VY81_9LAMI